jgi:hypothetical protein
MVRSAPLNGSDRYGAAHELVHRRRLDPSEQERALLDVVRRAALEDGDWHAAAWLLEHEWSLKAEGAPREVVRSAPPSAARLDQIVADQVGPLRVGRPGRKPEPLPEGLEADIAQRMQDPDAPGFTQREIGERHGLTRGQVKHYERRIRRRRERSG